MKGKKCHIVETIPKSNREIIERGKMDDPNMYILITLTFQAWYFNR